ncbi:hypothetical protein ATO6_14715 [Oceanicola sp. 22II-s10i]|nr:hypothetical protein ATO6_14715 [Oceanicola sp. 22II-s10i]
MRRYMVSVMDDAGREKLTEHLAPATSEFENAFNAFARGTIIKTADGPCAIEDLRPGMMVETLEHGPQPVRWIGSMTMVSTAPVEDPAQSRLTRVTPGRFGYERPATELMVGPGARILHRPDALQDDDVRGHAYTAVTDFVDGDSVFEVSPMTPVETFHICLDEHATIRANGLPVETYHPGYYLQDGMGPNKLALFMSLFPHLTEIADFGVLAHPRMSLDTLISLDAA